MKIRITLGLFLAAFLLSAQTAKLNRDIEVAEKILETLVEEVTKVEEEDFFIFSKQKVSGSYIDDFGALFNISAKSLHHPIILSESSRGGLKSNSRVFRFDTDEEGSALSVADKEKLQADFKQIAETFFYDYAYLLRALKPNDKLMIQYGGNALRTSGRFPTLITKNRNGQK
ncbi:MAG: hypothetical protein AAGJ18_11675, partial [Bacteroidota bacterium]